jgi:putative ABC transport system substrate-binding protein
VRRREFITLLGGAAAAWPPTARAQQSGGMRRVGVLTDLPSDDSEAQVRNAAFLQSLQELGWTVGRNLQIDFRWGKGRGAGPLREYAVELVALAPGVILAVGVSSVTALQQAGGSVPMVFVQVSDPVGAGFVANLARPGGNITGFTLQEYGISAKWLELLKEIAPRITRAAILRDPSNPVSGALAQGGLEPGGRARH